MSSRKFSMVSPSIWRSQTFGALNERAKLLQLYFVTCSHQNSCGCFSVPDLYICADLGWKLEEYAQVRNELCDAQLISWDPATSTIFVRKWFRHCPPMNDKHAQGAMRLISEIENDDIRSLVEEEFIAAERARKPQSAPAPLISDRLSGSRLVSGVRY